MTRLYWLYREETGDGQGSAETFKEALSQSSR